MADRRTPIQKRHNTGSGYTSGVPLRIDPNSEPVVWMGYQPRYQGGALVQVDTFEPLADARYAYGSFSPEQSKRFFGTMDRYFGKGRWNASYGEKMWARSLNMAAYANAQGIRITPFDALDNYLAQAEASGSLGRGGGRGGGGGPTRIIDEQETIRLTNPTSARSFVDNALQTYLGRRPNKQEYRSFLEALNAAESAAPERSISDTRTSPGGATMRRQTRSLVEGGTDPRQLAEEFARSRPEAAEVAVSTTAINAFLELMGV